MNPKLLVPILAWLSQLPVANQNEALDFVTCFETQSGWVSKVGGVPNWTNMFSPNHPGVLVPMSLPAVPGRSVQWRWPAEPCVGGDGIPGEKL